MASTHKIEAGVWEVRWREAGRQRSRRVHTARAAKDLQAEVQRCEDLGRTWRPTADLPTLPAALVEFLAHGRRIGKSENTTNTRGAVLNRFVTWARAHLRREPQLTDIDRPLVASWHTQLAAEVSLSSAAAYVRILELAWGWLSDHDTYGETVRRKRALELAPTQTTLEPYAPAWWQADAAVLAAYQHGNHGGRRRPGDEGWYGRLFEFMRASGLRPTESTMLEWSHLDLDRGLLTIPAKISKQRRTRVIPLAPVLLAELPKWGRRDSWLIPGPENRAFYYKTLWAIWRDTGYEPGQPQTAFRRCFMTGLREKGVDTELTQILLGNWF